MRVLRPPNFKSASKWNHFLSPPKFYSFYSFIISNTKNGKANHRKNKGEKGERRSVAKKGEKDINF